MIIRNLRLLALIFLLVFGIFKVEAQRFNGFINSDFSGVIGVRSQPASVANSPYKFDFSLVNGNFYLTNDIAVIAKNDEGGSGFIRQEGFQDRFAIANASLGGLSALLSLSRNRGIGIQYNFRTLANGTDITPNFI
ncbi:MAG: hypothetical protein JJ909_12745, partial [Roseivirga sp.]|nr:hypothetical protein [Roseivirga sp.]